MMLSYSIKFLASETSFDVKDLQKFLTTNALTHWKSMEDDKVGINDCINWYLRKVDCLMEQKLHTMPVDRLLEGYKKGFGIICQCCNCEVSPSQFEAHAGWASRQKPYAYIYTSNGVSLHELAISLSKGCYSSEDNDNTCIICADGGDLLFCDGCQRAFHRGSITRFKIFC
ncbi:hypothetical protein V6N12_045438 [Hibiscus sabdariffa]|uniref:Tify domain-containing protein n=1 Tax=Hibiscus sabdariffa TaxID=183260 RepID=A0ABR2G2P9_9ROSI